MLQRERVRQLVVCGRARQTAGMDGLPPAARTLETRIRDEIPIARAIDITMDAWDGETLALAAPLAPNINDKGCAFGGSLASVMTIAGWALVVLMLEARAQACDVFVGTSEIAYLAPVWHDFRAQARLGEGAAWDAFFATLARRGKARIRLRCEVAERGSHQACAALTADFVAKRHGPADAATTSDTAQ